MSHKLLFIFLLCIPQLTQGQASGKLLYLEVLGNTPEETEIITTTRFPTSFSERNALDHAIDSLATQLTYSGYFDLSKNVLQKNDSLYIAKFTLGNRFENLEIHIPKNKLLMSYIAKSGFTIKDDTIELETAFAKAYLEQLTTIASNTGNPFATFQIIEISKKNSNTLLGILNLTTYKSRTIDEITIKGYEDIPKSFLRYYAGFKKGESFSQKKLTTQSETLATLPFVNQTKDPDVLFTKDSTAVFLYLERSNVNRFDGFLGFANEEDTGKLRLDGYLDLLLINNLNYGESLSLNYKADGGDQSQLSIQTQLPYLFKSPLGIEAALKLFRKDSTFSTTEQSIDVLYQLSRRSSVAIGYTGLQSEDLTDEEVIDITNLQNFTTNKATTTYSFTDRVDDFFFPVKRSARLKMGFGNRTSLSTKEEQISLEATLENIFTLNEQNSIYIRSATNYLISDNYLTNELYRFGGILTIRGFEENSIFANLYSTLNSEYRYKLNNSIYINSIIDLGYFENDIENIKQKLFSFGIGTGIRTKAGVLKINLANGKFEDSSFQFSNTKLHIILQVAF